MTNTDVKFVYPTHLDPARQADPHGIYLDDLQRHAAETQRAKVEDREPDYDKAGSTCGTPLVPIHVAKSQRPGDLKVDGGFTLPVDLTGTGVTVKPSAESQDLTEPEASDESEPNGGTKEESPGNSEFGSLQGVKDNPDKGKHLP